jgi:hypothetical protein
MSITGGNSPTKTMALPENMSANLERELTKKALLDPSLANEVTAELEAGRSIKWNLLLAKQIELEKGDVNEADN